MISESSFLTLKSERTGKLASAGVRGGGSPHQDIGTERLPEAVLPGGGSTAGLSWSFCALCLALGPTWGCPGPGMSQGACYSRNSLQVAPEPWQPCRLSRYFRSIESSLLLNVFLLPFCF